MTTVRSFSQRDAPQVAAVRAAFGARGWWGGGDGWFGHDQLLGSGDGVLRLAAEEGGRLIGYAVCWRHRGGVLGLDLAIAPEDAELLLPALLDPAERWARDRGGSALEMRLSAANARPLAVLAARGYREINRMVSQVQDLGTFEPGRFDAVLARVRAGGVSLGDLPQDTQARADSLARLAHVRARALQGRPITYLQGGAAPAKDSAGQSLAELAAALPGFLAIARSGEDPVGYSVMTRLDLERRTLCPVMTAVDPRHQGKGIATALKVVLAARAKSLGFAAVRTSTPNPPMRRVNERLGYVEDEPAELRLARALG